MKIYLKKAVSITMLLLFVISLFGCFRGGASEGYKLRKQETKDYYVQNGITKDVVNYTSCEYVSIVREDSKTVYFYKASYTTLDRNYIEYFAWIEGDSVTKDSSEYAYNLAYQSVMNGTASGKTGRLS